MGKVKIILLLMVGSVLGFFIGMFYQQGWYSRVSRNEFCNEIAVQYLEIMKDEKGITSFDGGGDWEKIVDKETQILKLCDSDL